MKNSSLVSALIVAAITALPSSGLSQTPSVIIETPGDYGQSLVVPSGLPTWGSLAKVVVGASPVEINSIGVFGEVLLPSTRISWVIYEDSQGSLPVYRSNSTILSPTSSQWFDSVAPFSFTLQPDRIYWIGALVDRAQGGFRLYFNGQPFSVAISQNGLTLPASEGFGSTANIRNSFDSPTIDIDGGGSGQLAIRLFSSSPPPAQTPAATAYDFNLDGYADNLWVNQVTGTSWIQYTRNGEPIGGKALPFTVGSPWVWHSADFDGDGQNDLLFRNPNTGTMWIAYLVDGVQTGGVVVPISIARPWELSLQDFNGDGVPDFLWRNTNTGVMWIQFLDENQSPTGGRVVPLTIGRPWDVLAGQMNDDGFADLVVRNRVASTTWISFLESGVPVGGTTLDAGLPGSWELRPGDLGADGATDLLWRELDTGDFFLTYLGGANGEVTLPRLPGQIAQPWKLVGSR